MSKFQGYRRANGQIGIRNHFLVLSSIVCANQVVENIAKKVNKSRYIAHPYGCAHLGEDHRRVKRTLIGHGQHPNVGAVLVVGLGCEEIQAGELAEEIAKSGKKTELLVIQKEGGTLKTTKAGIKIGRKLTKKLENDRKKTYPSEELILGVECGGSDFSSGLAANPALGKAADTLVEHGGTVILSETSEMLGTEHILKQRACTTKVARHIQQIIDRVENLAKEKKVDIRGAQPAPGNIEGGLTTIEEKSLGAILKGGSSSVQEVVDFSVQTTKKGLCIMDTSAHDVESMTGMIAGGAQVIAFTTGRGTPTGAPIAPVIKITGNQMTYQNMQDNIDIDVSPIITGEMTIEEGGKLILKEILKVASGKKVKAEKLGHHEFGIHLSTTI